MNRLIFTFVLSLFVVGIYSQEQGTVIYSNDFENTPLTPEEVEAGFNFGSDLWVRCYHGEAAWDAYVATGAEAISGNQSFCLDVINPGPEFWGLQFILNEDRMPLEVDATYSITFKIKSETANNLVDFRGEGDGSFQRYIDIYEANEVLEVSYTYRAQSSSLGFKWFFGVSNVGKVWIDDVVFTKLPAPQLSTLTEDFNNAEINGDRLGNWEFGTYAGNWDYGLDVDPQDVSNKFLRLQPIEEAEWWAYQFKTLAYAVKQGQRFRVQFKAKSDVPNAFQFKIENSGGFEETLELSGGNNFENFDFETNAMNKDGMVGVLFAFGPPTVTGSTIWLDDIVITEIIVPELTEIREDFETNTIIDDAIGDFGFETHGDNSTWTYAIEEEAGNKFLRLNIGENTDWWAFQFKTEKYRTTQGKQYTISFKARSSVANEIWFQAERNIDHGFTVELSEGSEFKTFTFDTKPMDSDGVTKFLLGFGVPTVVGSIIDLDDIVIKEMAAPEPPELVEIWEDFETNTIDGEALGHFVFGTYEGDWTYAIEEEAGNKHLRLDIGENPDWWAHQFKTNTHRTLEGKEYSIQFKAKSPVENKITVRAEWNVDFQTTVTFTGGTEYETFTVHTPPVDKDGLTNFILGFGKPTVVGSTIYIDDIKITPKEETGIPAIGAKAGVSVWYSDNRLIFPVELQANVWVYDILGSFVAQGRIGAGVNTLAINNDYRILIVKVADKEGNITTSKVMLSR